MHLEQRSHGRGGSFSATCIAVLLAVLGLPDVGAATQSAGPLRDLWSRGSERFVRNWLVLGPVAASALTLGAGDELVSVDLRQAVDELGKVVGVVVTDDILDRIFRRFCIGK